ncbi:MAG: hypothetical protein ACMV0J_07955 [Fluviibacter sp.]|jgi:hypothetical protein
MEAGQWFAGIMLRRKTNGEMNVNAEFGQRLYLTGVGVDVTADEMRAFLFKYIKKMPETVDRVDAQTAQPAYLISFPDLVDGEIQQFASRINGVYWHEHQLRVHVM